MKTTHWSTLALAILPLVVAQPHGNHHHRHPRRSLVTELATQTQDPTEVYVIVDEAGKPIATSTTILVSTRPTAPPVINEHPTAAPQPPPSTTATPSSEAAAVALSLASAAPSSSPMSSTDGAASGHGITYTPYADDGGCKKGPEVVADFQKLGDHSMVRLYGTDCNQLATVVPVVKAKGMKLIMGIANKNVTANKVDEDVAAIVAAVGSDWSSVVAVGVGNEPSLNGISVDVAIAAVQSARTGLRKAGFQGPVAIIDTFAAVKQDPRICQNSDITAINLHAFFDPNTAASGAGKFVTDQVQLVAQACNNKKVIVTESGWPTQGKANNKAVPSLENQRVALQSIKQACDANHIPLVLFSAFNDKWKKDFEGSLGCEKFWGLYA